MNILLLRPPPFIPHRGGQRVPPLGILYLASALKRKGYSPTIIDCVSEGLTWRKMIKRVSAINWDITGVSVFSPTIESVRRTMNLLRPFSRYLIAGGPHVTATGKKIFDDLPLIDFAVLGDGEGVLPLLVGSIERGDSADGVCGVLKRERAERGCSDTERIERIEDLDSISFPAFELVDVERYSYLASPFKPVFSMVTSRGCPFSCLFCDKSSGSTFRYRSPRNVVEEIEVLLKRYNIKFIVFYDDIFTHMKERVEEICRLIIERNLRFAWKCEARVDEVDRKTLSLMKRAGCRVIGYGVESIKRESLDFLCKGVDQYQIREAIRMTKEIGIEILAYLIAGIPVESCQDFRQSIDFCIEEGVDYLQISTLSPLPATPLYRMANERGWIKLTRARNPFDAEVLRPSIISGEWDEKSLSKEMMRGYLKFYIWRGKFLKLLSHGASFPRRS